MLYSILKTIIDTTIHQYVCQSCQGKIQDTSITVIEVGEKKVHLDIICPHCNARAQIHAEVANVPGELIPGQISTPPSQIIPKNSNALKDTDIEKIEATLKSSQTIEDLLK